MQAVLSGQVVMLNSSVPYRVLADLVLLLHAAFVVFVIVGLVLIILGGWRGWRWVRNPWFRLAHLLAIGVVVTQAWLGVLCPLTTLEMTLRIRAGEAVYPGSFIAHWLETLLYYRAPAWVFTLCYTLFGLLVIASWYAVCPRPFSNKHPTDQGTD
jgi:hypothetical protein